MTRSPTRIDAHGYAAEFQVERSLYGPLVEGELIRIAWEEMAPDRTPRFAEAGRVLVALEKLPSQSLWRKRFPEGKAWAVAERGAAFLRDPDPFTVREMARYVAIPSEEREGATGVEVLCALAARAQADVATSAIQVLGTLSQLRRLLAPGPADLLARALSDAQRSRELREEILVLIRTRRLEALRDDVAELAVPGSAFEAPATAALATLDGSLPPERLKALVHSGDPALRALGVRWARASPAEAELPSLLRLDPEAEVRLAAAESLIAWHGVAALGEVEPALFDPEPRVRAGAARAVGSLGAAAVPRLRTLLDGRGAVDATGPIAALRYAGPGGVSTLREIAASHPDERVRALAALALGRDLGRH